MVALVMRILGQGSEEMADIRRLVGAGFVPALAKEIGAQIDSGSGNIPRLAELSMVPPVAAELVRQLKGGADTRRLMELGLPGAMAGAVTVQMGTSTPTPTPGPTPTPSPAPTPPPSSAMLARYRADQPATVTRDGSNLVSLWADANGAGHDLSQASTGSRPTYVADSGDGQPCIRLINGKIMRNTTATTQAEDAFFFVVRVADYVSGADALFGRGTAPTATAASFDWNAGGSADGTNALRNADPMARNKWIILSGRRSAATNMYPGGTGNLGLIELRENGAVAKRITHTSTDLTATNGTVLGQSVAQMDVKEAIWFNRSLTDGEMQAMEDELNGRYNVYGNVALRRTLHPGTQRWMTRTGASAPSSTKPLYVVFGQSNAGGEGLVSDVTALPSQVQGAIPNAMIYNPTSKVWETLQAGVNNLPNSVPTSPALKHGIELTMMRDLAVDLGASYLVKSSTGGTALVDRWDPTLPKTNNLWRVMVDRVEEARNRIGYDSGLQLNMDFSVWYQGEADAALGGTAVSNYAANERAMLAATRSFLFGGPAMKFIVPKIKNTAADAAYEAVTAAKQSNVGVVPNYQVTEGWESSAGVSGPHGNSTSMLKLGNTIAGLIGATTTTLVA